MVLCIKIGHKIFKIMQFYTGFLAIFYHIAIFCFLTTWCNVGCMCNKIILVSKIRFLKKLWNIGPKIVRYVSFSKPSYPLIKSHIISMNRPRVLQNKMIQILSWWYSGTDSSKNQRRWSRCCIRHGIIFSWFSTV